MLVVCERFFLRYSFFFLNNNFHGRLASCEVFRMDGEDVFTNRASLLCFRAALVSEALAKHSSVWMNNQ